MSEALLTVLNVLLAVPKEENKEGISASARERVHLQSELMPLE